jgi:hypothetical protein
MPNTSPITIWSATLGMVTEEEEEELASLERALLGKPIFATGMWCWSRRQLFSSVIGALCLRLWPGMGGHAGVRKLSEDLKVAPFQGFYA